MAGIELVGDCDSGRVSVTHTRGDRFGVTLRFDGDRSAAMLALVEALDGVVWTSQIRTIPSSDDVVADCTVTDSLVGNVLTVIARVDDTDDVLEAGESYAFDIQAVGGDIGIKTFLPGSTIYVEGDVTREEGS